MAVQVMAWVFDHAPKDLKPSEMLVALVLADHANPEGGLAYPSVPRISRMTRLGERTVQGALRTLAERGVIKRHLVANGPRPDVYCFPTFRGAGSAGVSGASRGASSAGVTEVLTPAKNDILPPQILRQNDTTPIKEPSKEPTAPPTPSRGGAKARRRIPDDWVLTEALREFAWDRGIEPDRVEAFAEEFHTFWLGDGRPKADWDQAFRNRVLEVADRKGLRPHAVASSQPPPVDVTPEQRAAWKHDRDEEARNAREAEQTAWALALADAENDPQKPAWFKAETWASMNAQQRSDYWKGK